MQSEKAKSSTGWMLRVAQDAQRADILYLTRFQAPDPFLLLTHPRQGRILLVSELEYGRARRCAPVTEVLTPQDLGAARRAPGLAGEACALLRVKGIRHVTVPDDSPVGLVETLRRAHIRVALAPAPTLPERAVKSAQEMRWMRLAQRAAVAAMRASFDVIHAASVTPDGRLRHRREILTSEGVQRVIEDTLRAHNCSAEETIVACGPAAADPHERGAGPLQAHRPIVIDIFPRQRRHGYWGDLTRTVVKGQPAARAAAAYAAVRAAHRAALAALRPRRTGRAIDALARREIAAAGFAVRRGDGPPRGFIHSLGHGVGLAIHEAPRLSPLSHDRLRTGHVVTVEPGIYEPEWGGVRLEDTVEITPTGYRLLCPCPDPFLL